MAGRRGNPHGEVVFAVGLTDLERLDDVRMIEARGDASLVEEHLRDLRILEHLLARFLQDDELREVQRREALGHREIHLGHAAASEIRDEAVLTELDAAHECILCERPARARVNASLRRVRRLQKRPHKPTRRGPPQR